MDNATKMIPREEPRFVQFRTGDLIEGVLAKMEKIGVRDKVTNQVSYTIRYTVTQDDGRDVCFLGTHQINSKLRPDDVRHRISVKCAGENTMVKRGDNCMKVFDVMVSAQPVSKNAPVIEDSGFITDEDIPF